jgi:hypothetical protein
MAKGGKPKKRLAVPPMGPASGKQIGNAKGLLPGAGNSSERLCWRFTYVDHESRWDFCAITPALMCEILGKMSACESMTIDELRKTWRLFKDYELPGGLCKEALDRLTATGRDDQTKIQRLEFKGTQRLYGFLEDNVFHVIWWDPDHEVYPSTLKNT